MKLCYTLQITKLLFSLHRLETCVTSSRQLRNLFLR
jgi:hypothetical protein